MNKKLLILNSALLFILATLLQQMFHELAHYITAKQAGAANLFLFHNHVSYESDNISMTQRLWIAAAGPLCSLSLGILFHIICRIYMKRNLLFLFFLYSSVFGYIAFGGYLLVAPFFKVGDTGFLFMQLGFPTWLVLIFAAMGAAFIFFMVKTLSKYYVEMGTYEIMVDKDNRRSFIRNLIEFPLYIGVVITSLLSFPIPVFLSVLYPFCSPFSLFWGYGYYLNTPYPPGRENQNFSSLFKLSPLLLIITIIAIVGNRLLVNGLHF